MLREIENLVAEAVEVNVPFMNPITCVGFYFFVLLFLSFWFWPFLVPLKAVLFATPLLQTSFHFGHHRLHTNRSLPFLYPLRVSLLFLNAD